MSISIYSMIMAILWFDAFILLNAMVRRKTKVLLQYSLFPLLAVSLFGLIRISLPVEIAQVKVVRSGTIFPFLVRIWQHQLTLFHIPLKLGTLVMILCSAVSGFLLLQFALRIQRDNLYMEAMYTEEDERANRMMQEIIGDTKPGKNVTIHIAPDLGSPIITGFFHPVILLPDEIQSFSDKQLKYILRHEWNHFLSKDLWTKLLIQVLCCVMWWNPPMYLLKREFEQVLELNCDNRVTVRMTRRERLEYLETMLEMLKRAKANSYEKEALGVSFIGINRETATSQRFQMVYDQQKSVASWKTNVAVITFMTALFFASYLFIIQPYTLPTFDPSEQIIEVTSENAFLVKNAEGSYTFYLYGERIHKIQKEDLKNDPYHYLPVFDALID